MRAQRNDNGPIGGGQLVSRREFFAASSLAMLGVLVPGCNGRAERVGALQPGYAGLEATGELEARVDAARALYERCRLCPRQCGVNRQAGQLGFCRAPARAVVASFSPHYGEELPLVGRGGSGTIFFAHCNLRCVFCQNWPIAHLGRGREIEDEELAEQMLRLQQRGCHNINVVTPTHFMPSILAAVRIAMRRGLTLPICYNTSGYETLEAVQMLEGVVDLYLPDLKFMDGGEAERYNDASASDYPKRAKAAIRAMHEQVGTLQLDANGVATRGLIVRHLVMPNRIAGTREFVEWVAANLSTDTYVNIMSQYRVEHRAFEFEPIARAITSKEFVEAIEWAQAAGLTRMDERSMSQYRRHKALLRLR